MQNLIKPYLKAEVDKSDIDKLIPAPADLSNLSDAVKCYVVEKTVYENWSANINNIDTSEFILKAKYDTDKLDLENKISDNAKITEIRNKIPSINGLATNTALTTVENKMPNISSLVK